jgi:hypothetical protein
MTAGHIDKVLGGLAIHEELVSKAGLNGSLAEHKLQMGTTRWTYKP